MLYWLTEILEGRATQNLVKASIGEWPLGRRFLVENLPVQLPSKHCFGRSLQGFADVKPSDIFTEFRRLDSEVTMSGRNLQYICVLGQILRNALRQRPELGEIFLGRPGVTVRDRSLLCMLLFASYFPHNIRY